LKKMIYIFTRKYRQGTVFHRTFGRYLFVVLFIPVLLIGGCNHSQESEPLPSVDEILADYLAAQAEIGTYRSEMVMDTDISQGGSEGVSISSMSSLKSAVDTAGERFRLEIETTATASNNKSEYSVEIILIGDTLYVEENDSWTSKILNDDEKQSVWQQQTGLLSTGSLDDILESSAFRPVTIEERDGIACYRLDATPDTETFGRMLQSQLNQDAGNITADPAEIAGMFRDISVIYFIDRATCNLAAYEISASIASETPGREISGYIKNNGRFFDYGEAVEIEPPPVRGES
jgi:hypothetical protein